MVFEKSLNCVKKRRKSLKVFKFFSEYLIIRFPIANKIDWLKQDFRKYRRKGTFYIGCDLTNYWVKMLLTLAIFRQLIALNGL